MYTGGAATVLLCLVLQHEALACRPDLLANCEGHEELTVSGIILPNPEKIDFECDRYDRLFTCVSNYLGSCDFKKRLSWQPIVEQVQTLCSASRKGYVSAAGCWADDLNTEIEICYLDISEQLEETNGCERLDEFVECTVEATADLCYGQEDATVVMRTLANTYVSMPREYLKCRNNTTASTTLTLTTTTTATTTTTTTAAATTPTKTTPSPPPTTTTTKTSSVPVTHPPYVSTTRQMSESRQEREDSDGGVGITVPKTSRVPGREAMVQTNQPDSVEESNFETRPLMGSTAPTCLSVRLSACLLAFYNLL